jgi:glycosyltransferase involved in cell wall biosynthesis
MVISWISYHGRSADLAERLGGQAEFISAGRQGQRLAVVWRYPLQALRTVAVLRNRRPHSLVVMAPPLPLVLLALWWARRHGGAVVIDAHTSAVISPRTGRPRRRFAAVARRADLVLVTRPELAALLPGVRTLVLDDPPVDLPDVVTDRGRRDGLPVRVVYPCSWYADEPVADVVDAARALPGIEFVLTGTPRGEVPDAPDNVTLTGYLGRDAYWSLLRGADLALALTSREHTMQRAGYEALAAGVPLVVSNTAALASWYGAAAEPAGRGCDGVVRAITAALGQRAELVVAGAELRSRRTAEFERGVRALRSIGVGSGAELGQQRREAVGPAVAGNDEASGVGAEPAAQAGIAEQPRERSRELVGSVCPQIVVVGDGVDATHAEGRRDDRDAGTEGIEHLEPAAATTVDRHDHRSRRGPHAGKVVDEPERTYPLEPAPRRHRKAAPSHDLQLDESLSPG